MASAYVENLRKQELEKIDAAEKLRDFKAKYKKNIEDNKVNASNFTGDDLKMYNEVKKEVEWEEKQGAAFLFAFQNPYNWRDMRNKDNKED